MSKRSKRNGNRARKRQNVRKLKKWVNESIDNRIENEFNRLDQVKKAFPDGDLRVAQCPISLKPILQAFTYPDKIHTGDKCWMCLHESGKTHRIDPDDDFMYEEYLRKE